MTEPKINPQRVLQFWILAVVLVVLGVLLARLIRAALRPALRAPETELELHLANLDERGSVSLLHTTDPWRSRGRRPL